MWAADVVGAAADEWVLEVGCGHGVLVSLLAERVTGGTVVGVDRSATMVATATRRNQAAIDAGRVRVAAAVLTAADLDAGSFDVVVAFNVRAFWTPPAPEWDVVDRVLAPGGRVLVAFSVMRAGSDAQTTEVVERLAGERGLVCAAVHRGGTVPIESVAVELHRR